MLLADLLGALSRSVDDRELIALAYQLAAAVAELHEAGDVHKDIRSLNFLIEGLS